MMRYVEFTDYCTNDVVDKAYLMCGVRSLSADPKLKMIVRELAEGVNGKREDEVTKELPAAYRMVEKAVAVGESVRLVPRLRRAQLRVTPLNKWKITTITGLSIEDGIWKTPGIENCVTCLHEMINDEEVEVLWLTILYPVHPGPTLKSVNLFRHPQWSLNDSLKVE